MRVREAAAGAVAALLVAAVPAAQADAPAPVAARFATTVYFLAPGREAPLGVRRAVPARSPRAEGALDALLAGPSAAQRRAGLSSALPPQVRLRELRIVDHTTALVDLAGLPRVGASAVERVRVITQLARTLIGLSGIERVRLLGDGEPWGLWRMDGGVADGSYGYDELLGFFGICTARPGTEAVPGDCFSALP